MGVSTSRNPRSWKNVRMPCSTRLRARNVVARTLVGHEVEVTLPVARLDVGEPVVLVRQRAQRLRQRHEPRDPHGRLAGFADEAFALDAEEIADVEQRENLRLLRREALEVDVNLDAPGQVAQVEEVRLAHVAVRGDAAGGAEHGAFREFLADLGDGAFAYRSARRRARRRGHAEFRVSCGGRRAAGWVLRP